VHGHPRAGLFADLEEATVAFGPQVARRHEPDEARTRVLADAALWFERLSAASARPDRVDEP